MPRDAATAARRPWLGLLCLALALAWILTLLSGWGEIVALWRSGFASAALSVLAHQLGWWTLVAVLMAAGWLILFALASRTRLSTLVASLLASALVASPLLLAQAYRTLLLQGLYFADLVSGKFLRFALSTAGRSLLVWLVLALGFEIWRRAPNRTANRSLAAAAGVLVLASVGTLLVGRSAAVPADDGPPNVILIVVDALRPDHLGTYGYERPTSMNIDALAGQGVRFDTVISQSTLTKTSIASLFTGLDPHRHGVYSGHRLTDGRLYSDTLDASLTTLASELRRAGLLTSAWLQQSQLKAESGYGRGFVFYNENSRDIATINRRFLRWIDRIGRSTPIFAYLHYIDLHDPYRPQPPYDSLYGTTESVRSKLDESRWKRTLFRIQTGDLELEPQDVEELIRLYDGQLTFIDAELGRLFEALASRGLFDSSLIMLTSDHGDGFMEHGFISHSVKPYDELVRVPLIVHLPRAEMAGESIERQVRLIDVMPSILDRLELAVPIDLDGSSIWRMLDEGSPEPVALSEVELQVEGGYRYFAAARTRSWKVIGSESGPMELYDLVADPGERQNLLHSESNPEIEHLVEALAEANAAREALSVDRVPIDEETQERLRTLGYID